MTTLPRLPARDPRGHKGTFGRVLVVGGCATGDARMIGAPALAARAALRAGAGLVTLLAPAPILDAAISLCPSCTGAAMAVDGDGRIIAHEAVASLDSAATSADAIVVGPGLGRGAGPRAVALRAVQHADAPVIVDADAINELAEVPELGRDMRAAAVLTPHPGEFKRLAASLRITIDPTDPATRATAAEALAQRLGVIVVLKGAGTIVSDGQRTWTSPAATSALSTAGTGDVLAGLAGALAAIARSASIELFDAACLAVHAHAQAAERWAASRRAGAGLLAHELADELPAVLESLRGPGA